MHKLIPMILGLAVLAGSLVLSISDSSAAKCPTGYVWVDAPQVGTSGRDINGWAQTAVGRCVKKSSDQSSSSDPPGSDRDDSSMDACVGVGNLGDGGVGQCSDRAFLSANLPALARALVVQLRLPPATPVFGPDPKKNEWRMLAVGFPVWLWTEGPRTKSATASAQGLSFRLHARLESTTFRMGDGAQVTCAAMTRYSSAAKPGAKSPTCGHVYLRPSLPKGAYTVTATANWQISWSVDGFSGSFPYSYSDSASIRIGELQALNR